MLVLVLAAVARDGGAEGRERRLVRDVYLALGFGGGRSGSGSERGDGRRQGGGERVGGDEDGEGVLGQDGELLLLLLLLLLSLLVSELHALSGRQLGRHGCGCVSSGTEVKTGGPDGGWGLGGENNKGILLLFCPRLLQSIRLGRDSAGEGGEREPRGRADSSSTLASHAHLRRIEFSKQLLTATGLPSSLRPAEPRYSETPTREHRPRGRCNLALRSSGSLLYRLPCDLGCWGNASLALAMLRIVVPCKINRIDHGRGASFTQVDSSLSSAASLADSHLHVISTKSALPVARRPSQASARQVCSRTVSSAHNRAFDKSTNPWGRDGQALFNHTRSNPSLTQCATAATSAPCGDSE